MKCDYFEDNLNIESLLDTIWSPTAVILITGGYTNLKTRIITFLQLDSPDEISFSHFAWFNSQKSCLLFDIVHIHVEPSLWLRLFITRLIANLYSPFSGESLHLISG